MEEYVVLPRPARSDAATFPTARQIVPGKSHQITRAAEANREPNTSGIAIGASTARIAPETKEIRNTWRKIRHVKEDASSCIVRAVRGNRAVATDCGNCQSDSETVTPTA